MAKRFNVDKKDLGSWLKVLVYTILTAVIIGVVNVLSNLDLPIQYLWLAPLINTVMVALKDFISNTPLPINGNEDAA